MSNTLQTDPVITHFTVKDVRFPTSLTGLGSDAMNVAGDYSGCFCLLHSSDGDGGHIGNGMTFTIGRGTEVVCGLVPYFAQRLVGKKLSELVGNSFGATWRHLTSDSQGVAWLALASVVNSLWDLWAKHVGKPVWRLVADMSPEELVATLDFRYCEDYITPAEAVEILSSTRARGFGERLRDVETDTAVPAYSTSAGWLNYDDATMQRLLRQGQQQGMNHFKLKVGLDVARDRHRLALARKTVGEDAVLMVDANQVWSVPQAVEWMQKLAEFRPAFIEEPTSPDDILGHAAIRKQLAPLGIKVASGEMCQSRIVFKQMLQAHALDIVQADACRVGGLNEVVLILLMAAKARVPVIPHSGGCGLSELTVQISTIDFLVVSGRKSMLEHVVAQDDNFVHPVEIVNGHYKTPTAAGYGAQLQPASLARYEFPGGPESWWRTEEAKAILEGDFR